MRRKEKVYDISKELIDNGDKISASKVSKEIGWPEQDVHRCLNALEKEGLVETHPREIMGKKIRMIGIYR